LIDLDLIVPEELFHEGEDIMINTFINHLVDEGGRKFIFGTSFVEIMEVSANIDGALLFINMGMTRYL
jgi:hypothetical protein